MITANLRCHLCIVFWKYHSKYMKKTLNNDLGKVIIFSYKYCICSCIMRTPISDLWKRKRNYVSGIMHTIGF